MILLEPHYLWLFLPLALLLLPRGPKHAATLLRQHLWLILSVTFIVVALSRPVLEQEPIDVEERGSDIIIALDLSFSMQADDVSPSRLEAARTMLKELIEAESKNRYGIIGYTTNAIILSPLSSDRELLLHLFEGLDETMIMTKGTVLMPALKLARKMSKSKRAIVVLLSDGGDALNYNEEASFAKENGLLVNVVLLGTHGGSTLKDRNGKVVKDEEGHIVVTSRNDAIEMVASASGGAVVESLSSLEDALASQKQEDFISNTKLMQYNELFYYFAASALLFAMLAFTFLGKKISRALSVLLLLFGINAQASLLEAYYFEAAKRDYAKENYRSAAALFSKIESDAARYNTASSYYRKGEYENALNGFMRIRTSDPDFKARLYFNMANCYIRLKEFAKAREMLIKSLTLNYDKEADENLAFIAKAEEQDHMLTGRQEGKKRAQDSQSESSPESAKKKEGGGSNQQSDADSSKGAGGKKTEGEERISFSGGKSRLSSKQYELINQRSVHETKPW
ncbi:VWA domain-containing protein [Sulfurimonas sp. HSL3-7]|uniref:vWA domain-containing protein n=1 Tax=Sulfonitrofixus jiaomeiensis TaxID=3131938 RepID=UPI0031F93CC9